ncbi:hypothetical protein RZE82_06465 [Mollicutes bacterium LVI A0039]|nr:hypothetical protein RZE82_06465 [Mollicutes bacterium LVI A0039]
MQSVNLYGDIYNTYCGEDECFVTTMNCFVDGTNNRYVSYSITVEAKTSNQYNFGLVEKIMMVI